MNIADFAQTTFTQISVQNASKRTTADWLTYFRLNRESLPSLPWDCLYQLTPAEKTAIARSIQTFQLGESSEGTHLMKLARDYAAQVGDGYWVDVVKLFIGEEQRHARDLERFMKQQQIAPAKHHWSDTLFRRLRHLANLEVAMTLLFTAELVATVYYPALGKATRSPLLQQLCQQISYDEAQHIRFQAETLRKLRRDRPNWQIFLLNSLYSVFFRAILMAIWIDHQSVFRASGCSFGDFYRSAVKCSELLIKGRASC